MRIWKLLSRKKKIQLLIVVVWRLFVASFIIYFGMYFVIEVGFEFYMGIGLYSILILAFVQSNKETFINFRNLIKDLEEDLEYDNKFIKED